MEKNGIIIDGAHSAKLLLTADNYQIDAEYIGCITPIAKTGVRRGNEICAAATSSQPTSPAIKKPAATISIRSEDNLFSQYRYYPGDNSTSGKEGESLFGWIIYRDTSLPDYEPCESGAGKECQLTLAPEDKNKVTYSCVQPRNQDGVWGPTQCETPNGNLPPEFQTVSIIGIAQQGQVLTLAKRYYDEDGDLPDNNKIQNSIEWYSDDTLIATGQSTYTVTKDAADLVFKACITPFSDTTKNSNAVPEGVKVCTTITGLPSNQDTKPDATPTISGVPLVGNVYRSSYHLTPASNRCLDYATLVRTSFGINFCSGQLNPDTWLGRSSAFAGAIPSLC
ncbi:hypothetical protein [Aeromonas sp. R7-5]|uniref:hypothetical protein n=1 Tax=Aeromonas sp. R7-5 TaxID=3138477 RepID=UPI0034A49EE1